uniref:hypothetical protein n=1 Tax=Lactobacillus acidophilus TaxID=1579 RepID=UPI003F544A77
MFKNDTEVFSGQEIIEKIESNLDDYEGPDFDTLFNDLFNSDYYIIGTYNASKELEKYVNNLELDGYETSLNGVFGAIDLVKQYEEFNFGVVDTDLSDPEKLCNMVEYIRAENVLNTLLDDANLSIDNDVNDESIKAIKKAIEETKKEGF